MTAAAIAALGCFLAWANGANDTLKGAAPLLGSGLANRRTALWAATAANLLGSLLAISTGSALAAAFSGRGLGGLGDDPRFAGATGLAAAATILSATELGLPVSTTHAFAGALAGASLVASRAVHWRLLWWQFAAPLLASPVLAFLLCAAFRPALRPLRRKLSAGQQTGQQFRMLSAADACLCLAPDLAVFPAAAAAIAAATPSRIVAGPTRTCEAQFRGATVALTAARAVEGAHWLSAAAISLARAMNDAPKIVPLLLAARSLPSHACYVAVAASMALGGMARSHKVAHTMGRGIAALDPIGGLAANLATAALVLAATPLGLPVSTTHVACGSLIAMGVIRKSTRWQVVGRMAAAWLTTVPLSASLAALCWWVWPLLTGSTTP